MNSQMAGYQLLACVGRAACPRAEGRCRVNERNNGLERSDRRRSTTLPPPADDARARSGRDSDCAHRPGSAGIGHRRRLRGSRDTRRRSRAASVISARRRTSGPTTSAIRRQALRLAGLNADRLSVVVNSGGVPHSFQFWFTLACSWCCRSPSLD